MVVELPGKERERGQRALFISPSETEAHLYAHLPVRCRASFSPRAGLLKKVSAE